MNAEIMAIDRLRIGTEGKGITSLVVFHGCPLHCRYCVNDACHDSHAGRANISPQKLLSLVQMDELYFLMTDGGITFGGGEPLLHTEFIEEFICISPMDWKYNIETSLNVVWDNIAPLVNLIDCWFVDIKDADDRIYYNYTGQHNSRVKENIRRLYGLVGKERLHIRVPYIKSYNCEEDVNRSCQYFAQYGTVDRFCYTVQ